jgi:predicted GNAT family N-acyltransferase
MAASAIFNVRDADYVSDINALRLIRDSVFVQEQKVPLELEWDAKDPECYHVLALDYAQNPIGTGRLTPEQTIGRMAVLPSWRGQRVGDALLKRLIAKAQALGWPSVSLHAQVSAIGFYQKHGFQSYGDIYQEAGIAHQSMSRSLINDSN